MGSHMGRTDRRTKETVEDTLRQKNVTGNSFSLTYIFDCYLVCLMLNIYDKYYKAMIEAHYNYIQGVKEKLCFFHCHPSISFIAVRDLQSSQRNASVQSLILAGNF